MAAVAVECAVAVVVADFEAAEAADFEAAVVAHSVAVEAADFEAVGSVEAASAAVASGVVDSAEVFVDFVAALDFAEDSELSLSTDFTVATVAMDTTIRSSTIPIQIPILLRTHILILDMIRARLAS
ncbi:MAG TPA: hypothetical protein VH157_13715 [Bryobacteraceae bacterium]|jgi:hypothetical protein|nr:hypothetical protein [Bryobacteraceae bacterium]